METLHMLEQRITQLVMLVKKLQDENARVTQMYTEAQTKIEALERSLLKDTQNIELLHTERELAKSTVDELIKSIDILMGEEPQP